MSLNINNNISRHRSSLALVDVIVVLVISHAV